MKTSSRSRLTRFTVADFPGSSLHDTLGRVISEAECLPRKEFFESWAVAKRVRRYFKGGRVVDLASGHGLVAFCMLLLDGRSPGALCVDTRRPVSFDRLHAAMGARWPRLSEQVVFHEDTLESVEVGPEDLLVGVHACGELTDRILAKAVAAGARVAVLPCCQVTGDGAPAGLEGWLEPRLAVDVVRFWRLREAGYRVRALTIPSEITPQNRLLLGSPS